MAAVIVEIAEAAVEALKAATLSQPFKAARAYTPTYDLKDFADQKIKVSAIPTRLETEARDLAPRLGLGWTLGLWVQKRAQDCSEDFDPLMLLVEEIALLFNGWRTRPAHRVVEIEVLPPYDPVVQRTAGLFSAVVLLTFRSTK